MSLIYKRGNRESPGPGGSKGAAGSRSRKGTQRPGSGEASAQGMSMDDPWGGPADRLLDKRHLLFVGSLMLGPPCAKLLAGLASPRLPNSNVTWYLLTGLLMLESLWLIPHPGGASGHSGFGFHIPLILLSPASPRGSLPGEPPELTPAHLAIFGTPGPKDCSLGPYGCSRLGPLPAPQGPTVLESQAHAHLNVIQCCEWLQPQGARIKF